MDIIQRLMEMNPTSIHSINDYQQLPFTVLVECVLGGACDAPFDVLQYLIRLHLEGVHATDSNSSLPLHHASRGSDNTAFQAVKILLAEVSRR